MGCPGKRDDFINAIVRGAHTKILIFAFYILHFHYQLDLIIPGISPLLANSRKQIRQRSKSRI